MKSPRPENLLAELIERLQQQSLVAPGEEIPVCLMLARRVLEETVAERSGSENGPAYSASQQATALSTECGCAELLHGWLNLSEQLRPTTWRATFDLPTLVGKTQQRLNHLRSSKLSRLT